MYKYKIKYKEFTISEPTLEKIRNPKEIFKILKKEFNPLQEIVYLIILNTNNNIINKIEIFKGGLNYSLFDMKVIFKIFYKFLCCK